MSKSVLEAFLSNTDAGTGAPPPSDLSSQPMVRTYFHQGPQSESPPSAIKPISKTTGTQSRGSSLGWRRKALLCALNFKGQTQRDRGEIGFFRLLKGITHNASWWGEKENLPAKKCRRLSSWELGAFGHQTDINMVLNEKRLQDPNWQGLN